MGPKGQIGCFNINKPLWSDSVFSSRNSRYFLVISEEYMYEATSADFWGCCSPEGCQGGPVSSFIFNVDKTCDVVIVRRKSHYIHLHFDMLRLYMCISIKGHPRKLVSDSMGSLQLAAGLSALLKRCDNQETRWQTMWLSLSAPLSRHENWNKSNWISIVTIYLGGFFVFVLFSCFLRCTWTLNLLNCSTNLSVGLLVDKEYSFNLIH